MKRKLFLLLIAVCLSALTGCHGSKGLTAFAVPEEFDDTNADSHL